ncbi:histone-lysine N-methyltransferase SETMAR [Trichonephila clavipes]|uniref:Histone-lysine N-methyltransferase SETMAR n=1 Tax=Trichonephila clavipes TaxID=2585209 RepID=A0A8X6T3R7_TRICX|nr:histone-lysine N-methyltransferase SETMAR [Trichonephila clavipes]
MDSLGHSSFPPTALGRQDDEEATPGTEEKMECTREHYRAMIFYDFKAGLNQKEYVQRLQLAFGDESPCRATVVRWFKEFYSGHNSLQDE